MEKKNKVIKTIVDVVLWVFLVFSVAMTVIAFASSASGGEYPKFGNTCFLTVQSDSMKSKEGFKKGDLIFCKMIDEAEALELSANDVITFKTDLNNDGVLELNTHRILSVESYAGVVKYTTGGDNVIDPDTGEVIADLDPVLPVNVVAKWNGKKIAGLGAVISFLGSQVGFLCCIILPLACFFVYELIQLILTLYKMKESKKNEEGISSEQEELIKQKAIEEYLAKQKNETEKKE